MSEGHDEIRSRYSSTASQDVAADFSPAMTIRGQVLIAAIIGGVFILALAGIKYLQVAAATAQAFTPPPEAITTSIVEETSWQRSLNAVGSLSPVQGVTLSNENAGTVAKINFENGSNVERGQILVELDTAVEEANLRAAEAHSVRTSKDLERYKSLKAQNATAVSEYDRAQAENSEAVAQAASIRALIERKRVRAPFSGKAGIRHVNVGEYLREGTGVVPVHALDSFYVNFSLPQQTAGKVQVGQDVNLTIDSLTGKVFSAKIVALDPNISETTRNLSLQGLVQNTEQLLKPGMFVKVSVILAERDLVIPIPLTAINYAPYGDSVYVVEKMKDPKNPDAEEFLGVRQQIIRLGEKRGDLVAVMSGLKSGEQIATAGIFKLRPGAAVAVNNDFKPGSSLNPTPADT